MTEEEIIKARYMFLKQKEPQVQAQFYEYYKLITKEFVNFLRRENYLDPKLKIEEE